ncbi:lipopolysaccharide transport periplasmic protein LptA [Endozoicomonas sp. GU-1]|uniref:lipopolysaccharide transport periplasmic protein LptA n=1 Tax=Endozoicomonas sp. GU-1 TaxID=3009078 RepID=UPI0022B54199|nr:lipopolysaccharide transport periplasmic protein LptA [Endozoicomonas sp. GU-1]WBA80886.1 lipopolysaccharide transport periplasmic protein LptA [Endozoicomonas sp. GU-1]WBA88450.1 lipopolysaccharide transport periplasmic protein LptA [Endozoicomonas sp. GU-1]
MTRRPKAKALLNKQWLVGLLFVPFMAMALPADRQQPIQIDSDTADIDNKKGVSVYRGDVVMTQGTTRITGDVITIYTRDRELTRVIARGNKARAYYEELQPGEQGMVQAWGNTIRYDVESDQIELIKNAQLSQKGDTFTGEQIDYNLTLQTVNAKGTPSQGDNGRVQMVIQPRQEKAASTK